MAFGISVLSCGQEPVLNKDDLILEDFGPPDFDISGTWKASWQDPERKTTEAFTMNLVQESSNVSGDAAFADANGTTADLKGQATGSKLRIVMKPQPTAPNHPLPELTLIGTVVDGKVSGTWYLHGKPDRGFASQGPWSATQNKE